MAVGLLVLGYLFLPICVVVALSFNRPSSRLSYDFDEFTLDNWRNPCGAAGMCASVVPQRADRLRSPRWSRPCSAR